MSKLSPEARSAITAGSAVPTPETAVQLGGDIFDRLVSDIRKGEAGEQQSLKARLQQMQETMPAWKSFVPALFGGVSREEQERISKIVSSIRMTKEEVSILANKLVIQGEIMNKLTPLLIEKGFGDERVIERERQKIWGIMGEDLKSEITAEMSAKEIIEMSIRVIQRWGEKR